MTDATPPQPAVPPPYVPPASAVPSHAAPPYAAPQAPPQYAAPQVPPPYVPPHVAPGAGVPGYAPAAVAPRRSPALGIVALALALVATIGAAIACGIAGAHVGAAVGRALGGVQPGDIDPRLLSPVRGWVLVGELGFWIGTALGVVALVLGAIGISTRRGLAWAVAAIVVAALGPVVTLTVLAMTLGTGSL